MMLPLELTCAAPIAMAMVVLALFLLIGLVLIPVLDAELHRLTTRLPANDNRPTAAPPPAAEDPPVAHVNGARP